MNQDEIKSKLSKLKVFEKDPQLALFGELQEVNNSLRTISEKEMPPMPNIPEMPEIKFPDIQKVEIAGIEVITIKGDKGDVGEKGEKGEKGEQGVQGIAGKDGKNGKDGLDGIGGIDGKDGLNGKDGIDGKNGETPDTNKIIEEVIKKIPQPKQISFGGIRRRDMWVEASSTTGTLGGAVNGSNKTFTIPTNQIPDSESVYADGLRLSRNRDFTVAGKTFTLVTAPNLTVDITFQKL